MELLSFETAAYVLDITPERLEELVRSGRIEHNRDYSNIGFTWGQMERFIQQKRGVDVFTAQHQIADKIWPE